MVAEKGADLIKELWLQENSIRYERDAQKSAPPSKKVTGGTTTKKSIKKKNQAATSKKVHVFTNATAA